ncbi:MAG: alpha-L-fucosidase [Chitinophagaceae bacterium]|nr:alpha-L-fucosidase [Chitinophagaceae bacterium]
MIRLFTTSLFVLFSFSALSQPEKTYKFPLPDYVPAAENLKAREEFQNMKYGLFIHWGIYSLLGDGEWVMFTRKIPFENYSRLADFFYPLRFDAKEWVQLAKEAGMKYITITSRHHDGFSMFYTSASSYNIVQATPFGRDILKELSDECKKQGIKLHVYYSQLDWARPDYGLGQRIVNGEPEKANWKSYIEFMKTQLTELLTRYDIQAIWFDGHWERYEANWHLDEIYALIHRLKPECLVGSNHHLAPLPGEDFQMFERDLPGFNTAGFNTTSVGALPLETCETMNNHWGFHINDRQFKSAKQIVHYLVNAAGRNANLLLNVGPMPDGRIQPECQDTLKRVGQWLKKFGHTIYNTRGSTVAPAHWGVATQKGKSLYIHVLNPPAEKFIFITGNKEKIKRVIQVDNGKPVLFKQLPEGIFLYFEQWNPDMWDTIFEIQL